MAALALAVLTAWHTRLQMAIEAKVKGVSSPEQCKLRAQLMTSTLLPFQTHTSVLEQSRIHTTGGK